MHSLPQLWIEVCCQLYAPAVLPQAIKTKGFPYPFNPDEILKQKIAVNWYAFDPKRATKRITYEVSVSIL
jgi:hypothetical protein